MIDIRPFTSLGHANHGWLDARHHFSFSQYHEPDRMGWGALRVWNDDTIGPQQGFPPHPHANMEIITYVRSGAITHRDSQGNHGRTQAGDVQVMSAGTGITHSEYNLEDEATTLFQIWIIPDEQDNPPSWGARPFPKEDRNNQWVALASGMNDKDALPIRAAARVVGATITQGNTLTYDIPPERLLYIVATKGEYEINGLLVHARDGVAVKGEDMISIKAVSDAELVVVDVSA